MNTQLRLLGILLISVIWCRAAYSDDELDKAASKYDSAYLVDGSTVFLYLAPGLSEMRFPVESNGLTRDFEHNGVPHRIVITATDGRVESVVWDDKPIARTTMNRETMEAANKLYDARLVVEDEEASDETRIRNTISIVETLMTYPDLALEGEPASLIRYVVRRSDGVILELINSPVEVRLPLLDRTGRPTTQRCEFEGGHVLEVRCESLQVVSVTWDGKPVRPAYFRRHYFIMPPGLGFLITLDESFQINLRDDGRVRQARLRGKTLSTKPQQDRPYYEVDDFTVTDVFPATGKLLTLFNADVVVKPPPAASDTKTTVTKSLLRTWKDATGKFSVKATFVELRDEQVVLQRTDGSRLEVPIEKLSESDQQTARRLAR